MTTINHRSDRTNPTDNLSAGWYPDPEKVHHLRYYNGNGWTDHVTHYGPTPCSGCAEFD